MGGVSDRRSVTDSGNYNDAALDGRRKTLLLSVENGRPALQKSANAEDPSDDGNG